MASVVSVENAEHYVWGDGCDGWHLVKSRGLSVIKERVPVGGREARHFHTHAEQFFYVEAGVASMDIDGVLHEIAAGQGVHVPAGLVHRLENRGPQELIFIVTSTPPSHGDRMEI